MKLHDQVEVTYDGNIGLTLVGERGEIVGPGENGYDWTVMFERKGCAFTMWFDEDELKVVEEGQA